jgi:hypothetical protein
MRRPFQQQHLETVTRHYGRAGGARRATADNDGIIDRRHDDESRYCLLADPVSIPGSELFLNSRQYNLRTGLNFDSLKKAGNPDTVAAGIVRAR